jgi:hypothetical protein
LSLICRLREQVKASVVNAKGRARCVPRHTTTCPHGTIQRSAYQTTK